MQHMVEVPGVLPLLTEQQSVPHGAIHRMMYHSKAVGHDRAVMVYTPPGYGAKVVAKYPVLCIADGYCDVKTVWNNCGRDAR